MSRYEKTLYINITNECNLRCPHCFKTDYSVGRVKFELIENMINNFKEIKNVILFGGEFLLPKNTDYVLKIIDFLHSNNTFVTGTTNLFYKKLDEKQLKILERIDGVSTSWNPERFDTPEHLQWWVDNLEYVDRNKLTILITLTKDLLVFKPATIYEMFKDKAGTIKFEPYIGEGKNRPDNASVDAWLAEFYDFVLKREKNTIFEPFNSIEFGFKNGVSTSTFTRQCDKNTLTLKVSGDTTFCPNSENLSNLDFQKKLFNFNEQCFPCKFFKFCKGNCPLLTFDETGCSGYPKLFSKIQENLNGY